MQLIYIKNYIKIKLNIKKRDKIMNKRISSVLMAKYLIKQAKEKNVDLDMVKLQKLLYILDGGLLANDVNVIDENCRAWKYGPVYPKVFKSINPPDDFRKNYSKLDISEINENEHSEIIKRMVEIVLDNFGEYSSAQLSSWSHRKNSPWSKTKINKIISKELIKNYFSYNNE